MKELVKMGQFDTYKINPQEKGEIRGYAKSQKDLVILYDLVYRRVQLKDHDDVTYQFAVPPKFRKRALELVHDEFGHLGIDRTTSLIQDHFYWMHMVEDFRTHKRDNPVNQVVEKMGDGPVYKIQKLGEHGEHG